MLVKKSIAEQLREDEGSQRRDNTLVDDRWLAVENEAENHDFFGDEKLSPAAMDELAPKQKKKAVQQQQSSGGGGSGETDDYVEEFDPDNDPGEPVSDLTKEQLEALENERRRKFAKDNDEETYRKVGEKGESSTAVKGSKQHNEALKEAFNNPSEEDIELGQLATPAAVTAGLDAAKSKADKEKAETTSKEPAPNHDTGDGQEISEAEVEEVEEIVVVTTTTTTAAPILTTTTTTSSTTTTTTSMGGS